MVLLSILFLGGVLIGAQWTYGLIVLAILTYAAFTAGVSFFPWAPLGLADLVPGAVALQLGYLAGAFGVTICRNWRRGEK